jgi:hypothetical protein
LNKENGVDMSMKWNIGDLVVRLKKQHVLNRQLMIGDIVATEHGCWQVAKILPEPGGFLTILDEDGNGFVNVPPNNITVVINRNCFGV